MTESSTSTRSTGEALNAFVTSRTQPPAVDAAKRRRPLTGRLVLAVVLVLLGLVPFGNYTIPGVLPGENNTLNSAATMQVLGLCFVFAGVTLAYDLVLGFTGMLSFGSVLFFATGVYGLDITLSKWHWPLLAGIAATLVAGFVLSVVVGAISLRVSGIAFAMVTLAFAQAGYYVAQDNPHQLTGGDVGLVMDTSRLPAGLVGVANTHNLYWLALAFLVAAYAVVWLCTRSITGQVWVAIRESEQRAEVLGLRPFWFKLASFVLSAVITTAGGMVYLLLIGTASPDAVASTTVAVSILIMLVLGGPGTRWGAVAGAVVYVYLQQWLIKLAGVPAFHSMPTVVRTPLSQPDFLLGALFIVFILFAPGGIAGLVTQLRLRRR